MYYSFRSQRTRILIARRFSAQQTSLAREKCCIVTNKKIEGSWRAANLRGVTRLRSSDVADLLRRRIQMGTHLGQIKPGDRLPSLRAAASEFGVDQRSVLSAYRQLESEGIVEMRPRSGIYVAGEPQSAPQIDASARWMSEMFLQGFEHGIPPIALGETLTDAVRAGPAITHPTEPDLGFLYGTIVTDEAGPAETSFNLCVFAERQIDRSPTGSGVTARMALDAAKGLIQPGSERAFRSITGGTFSGRVLGPVDGMAGPVTVAVGGICHFAGEGRFTIESDDPLGWGFALPVRFADIARGG